MAVWSVVNRSYLRESIRIDAEYHKPDDLALEEKLIEKGFVFLKGYLSGFCSGKNLPQYGGDGENVVPFIRTQNVRPFLINDDGISYCRYMKSAAVETGDILAVRVGAGVGDFSIVAGSHSGSCISDNVLRIRVSGINPFFLVTFLASRYGQQFFRKTQKGTARGLISRENFYFVPIPDIPIEEQQIFEELIKRAEIIRLESSSSFEQAQSLLESELGLDKLTFNRPVSYAARFSEVALSQAISANRIDAQCFSPAALQYEQVLSKLPNVQPLRFLTAAMAKGAQQEESPGGTIPYVSIKHIQNNEIVAEGNSLRFKGMPVAKRGDLLLAITGATIGKVGIVSRYEELTFSGDMLAITANSSINPHYLLSFLSHHIGQVQLQRWITGSTNGHLSPHDVGRILVPRLDGKLEQRIASLMKESIEKTHESERLLEQAKHRVEALIEEAIAA